MFLFYKEKYKVENNIVVPDWSPRKQKPLKDKTLRGFDCTVEVLPAIKLRIK